MSIQFQDNSIRVKRDIRRAVKAALLECAGEIEAHAKRNSRVDTGQTKGSYTHTIVEKSDGIVATVGSPLENAIWEEFGTGKYALKRKGRRGAWYVPVDSCKGKKKPTYNGKVVVVYGKNGKAFYKTNGKRSNKTLFKAFTTKKKLVKKRLEAALKGM